MFRSFNIHYRACIGSLIYLLSKRLYLSFVVHRLAKFSSNIGKVHLEGLVHLLRYIKENRTLGLNYHYDMNNAPLSNLLIQATIEAENQLIILSDSIWQYFPDTVRSTGAYIIFFKVGQLAMANMFQHQLFNKVQKFSTIQHSLQ